MPPGDYYGPDGLDMRLADWVVGNRYRLVKILGEGSYGQVAKAYDNDLKCCVAIKRIPLDFSDRTGIQSAYRELYILHRTAHDNVVRLIDVIRPINIDSFTDLYMVFEFVATDIQRLVTSRQYITNEHIQLFIYNIILALKYLQSSCIIHRDIKPANILVNEDCSIKICDFGISRILDISGVADYSSAAPLLRRQCTEEAITSGVAEFQKQSQRLTKHVVTRWYRAPEVILMQDYGMPIDMWAVGCIFAELIGMLDEGSQTYQGNHPAPFYRPQQVALFPGGSCYPLSNDKKCSCVPSSECSKESRMDGDQLCMILDLVGTPSQDVIGKFGTRQQAYLRSMPMTKPKALEARFPKAHPDAIDLLGKMLVFDPDCRITTSEALGHRYLDDLRDPVREQQASVGHRMSDPLAGSKPSMGRLKQMLYEELSYGQ